LSDVKQKHIGFLPVFALTAFLSVTPAYAGAMEGDTAQMPPAALTPLDHALMDIQNINNTKKEAAAPVSLAPPAEPAEQPRTVPTPEVDVKVVEAKKPQPVAGSNAGAVPQKAKKNVPPKKGTVPENRVVHVQPNSSFFGLSVGLYDAVTNSDMAASFDLEWQPGVKIAGVLQPIFGAMLTSNGAALGYAGVGVPFDLTQKLFLMPSVAVGAYHEGSGHDLDSTLAYRLGAELGWKLKNNSRISLNAHMITNGQSFSSDDRTEVFGIKYTTPLQNFVKKKPRRPY